MRRITEGTNVRVHSWSRNGWKAEKATQEKKQQLIAVRSRSSYQQPDFSDFSSAGIDIDLLNNVQSQIQVGLASDEMDSLPNSMKQLLQAPDIWHIANGKIMRVIDPITQAKDGEWGTDRTEADIDVLNENTSSMRMLLEDCHFVTGEDSEEKYQDMMGELLETANGELIPNAPMTQVDMSVHFVAEDEKEVNDNYDNDDYITQFANPIPIMPHLSNETLDEIKTIHDECIERIAMANNEQEREVLILVMDQRIDQIAGRELCNKLDSPYVGHKYTPPRRKHEFIVNGQESHLAEAARKREEFFFTLMAEATSCKTMEDLHGPIITETYTDTWTGEILTKNGRPGGFCGQIRGMYQHDRDLARKWSINKDDYTSNTQTTESIKKPQDENKEDSAFSIQRTKFIKKLRDENKDEETIRKSVFAWFDRKAGIVEPVYENGKLIKEGKRWKDSIWRQQRTDALKDLFLTKAQWNAIYKMINIQKERIKLNIQSNNKEKKAIEILQKHFERITNLQDLMTYRQWAEKRHYIYRAEYTKWTDEHKRKRQRMTRKWNTYDFNRSMIEYLSTNNATRWWNALIKKQRYLQGRLALFNKLEDSILSIENTNMEEVSIVCPYPKCERMAIGIPKFAEFQNNKGHLFVECDCGKKVWLIKYKESGSDIKTKEELCV